MHVKQHLKCLLFQGAVALIISRMLDNLMLSIIAKLTSTVHNDNNGSKLKVTLPIASLNILWPSQQSMTALLSLLTIAALSLSFPTINSSLALALSLKFEF